MVTPGLDHPVHQLPLSGEGVELQDFIRVVGVTDPTWIGTVIASYIIISTFFLSHLSKYFEIFHYFSFTCH